eukprot:m.220547 g.220547  ORF g.220547 m.220547 type:complete len:583 (+) comp54148_c0_seq1:104-1852(+)
MADKAHKRRSVAFMVPGERGRATGLKLKTNVKVNSLGVADVNEFFDSSSEDEGHADTPQVDEEEVVPDSDQLQPAAEAESLPQRPASVRINRQSELREPPHHVRSSPRYSRSAAPTPSQDYETSLSAQRSQRKTPVNLGEEATGSPVLRRSHQRSHLSSHMSAASPKLPSNHRTLQFSPEVEEPRAKKSNSSKQQQKPGTFVIPPPFSRSHLTSKSTSGAKITAVPQKQDSKPSLFDLGSTSKYSRKGPQRTESENDDLFSENTVPNDGLKSSQSSKSDRDKVRSHTEDAGGSQKSSVESWRGEIARARDQKYEELRGDSVKRPRKQASARGKYGADAVVMALFEPEPAEGGEEGDEANTALHLLSRHIVSQRQQQRPYAKPAPSDDYGADAEYETGRHKQVRSKTVQSNAQPMVAIREAPKSGVNFSKKRTIVAPTGDISVVDWTTEQVDANARIEIGLARPASSLEWSEASDGSMKLSRVFGLMDARWGSGMLQLPPGGTKPALNTHANFLVFYVIEGEVKVSFIDSSIELSAGASFFVPPKNVYSIENENESTTAKLFYTQVGMDSAPRPLEDKDDAEE